MQGWIGCATTNVTLRLIERLTMRYFAFLPHLVSVSYRERLRASAGAFLGIGLTALVTGLAFGVGADVPLLVAPIGASAVLLFPVPASPLAQPWSILGGNLISGTIGVACAQTIGDMTLAAAIAVALSIAAMLSLRCLHPPSGAVALTAVVGGPAIAGLGYGFVIWPVGVNSVLLLLIAVLFNRLSGKDYPHRTLATPHPKLALEDHAPLSLGVTAADLQTAIAERDEVVSVDPMDLEELLHRAEALAFLRQSGGTTASTIMTNAVAWVSPGTSLRVALRQLREYGIKALPVLDGERRVVGILTQTDIIEKADWGPTAVGSGLNWRLRAITNSDRPLRGRVRDVMSASVATVLATTPVARVIHLMLKSGHHHLPVVGDDGRILGIITQTDVVEALFHATRESPALPA